MKKLQMILIFVLFISNIYGQTQELQELIDDGIQLYDNGDYSGAIKKYKKVLSLDSKSPAANYEISMTYFAIEDYNNAIKYSDIVISSKSDYVNKAYVIKGSALDLSGKPDEAIKVYKKGIKKYPKSYLLYYNLAYTYFNQKEYKETEEALQKALKLNPTHPSSHLLLGYLMSEQGNRVKSILAIFNFLLLEPDSKRAGSAYEFLENQLKMGVSKQNDSTINISIGSLKPSDDFRSAELMLAMLEASKSIEKNKDKTESELFAENTKSLFTYLDEVKKNKKGFWWNFYVDFYNDMSTNNHVEAFCYFISQSKEDEIIDNWLKNNKDKISELGDWLNNYERKF